MPKPTKKDVRTTITQEEMDEADFDPEIQKAGDELLNGLEERETIYLNEGEASEEEQPKEFDLEEDGKKLDEFLYGEDNLSETVFVNPKELEEEPKKQEQFWNTQKYGEMLEATIPRGPSYWLWSHRRWKRTKEEWLKITHGGIKPKS